MHKEEKRVWIEGVVAMVLVFCAIFVIGYML